MIAKVGEKENKLTNMVHAHGHAGTWPPGVHNSIEFYAVLYTVLRASSLIQTLRHQGIRQAPPSSASRRELSFLKAASICECFLVPLSARLIEKSGWSRISVRLSARFTSASEMK